MCAEDRKVLEAHGKWHEGSWKGEGSVDHRLSLDSVNIMDNYLIDRINEIVQPNDTLWHLGDFAFARQHVYYKQCRYYRDRINCRNVNIVWGNHDQPRKIRDLFGEAYDLHEMREGNQRIILCHYAMAVWNKSHRGNWQLYGHSHSGAEPWLDANMPGRRSFDVGVDNANKLIGDYRPFSFDEVAEIMSKKGGFSMDHHIPRNSSAPTEESLQ